jgi:esterase/lipase superfamily enzyme
MKRSLLLAVVVAALVGCKSESDSARAPATAQNQQAASQASPDGAQPWQVDPATEAPPESGDAWRGSAYSPIGAGSDSLEPSTPAPWPSPTYSAADEPGAGAAVDPVAPPSDSSARNAPYGNPSAAAPEEQPAYDSALDLPGYGRPRTTVIANSAGPDSQAMRTGNPLRITSLSGEPSADPNPLRERFAPAQRSFAAAPPALQSNDPAGGAAPPASASVSDDPQSPVSDEVLTPGSAEGPASAIAQQEESVEASNMARMAMGEPPLAVPPQTAPSESAIDEGSIEDAQAPNGLPLPYDVVKVFYATDRAAWQPHLETWSNLAIRFWPTLAAITATVLFGFIAILWRHWLSATLCVCSVLTVAVVGYSATSVTLERARLAQKEGLRYTTERSPSGELHVGTCEVTIPKTHDLGQLEAPSVLRLEVREDEAKHVVLRKTERFSDEPFYEQLRERVAASPDRELFVFVHGFNVSFENAARRTAQMAHDLKYAGAPIFFSWPANERFLLTYAQDETNVGWAAPHLKRFLLDVARNSDAKSINVVAHSMGNRALATALRELQLELRDESRLFNQVILAAPDIDADDFRLNIAPFIQKTSHRITMYASSNDQALAASQLVHRYPRAGDSGQVLVVVPGIETIDVSAIDGGPWGHSYYGSSDPILKDIAVLFRGADQTQRSWLAAQDRDGLNYWIFQAQTASARAATSEEQLR